MEDSKVDSCINSSVKLMFSCEQEYKPSYRLSYFLEVRLSKND